MSDPANPVIVTRQALKRLGLNIERYNQLINPDIQINPIFQEENDDDDDNDNAAMDQDALIRSLQGLRTLAINLPKFDGNQQVEDWLEDFDRYSAETGRDTVENKLYDLISHLTGDARQWFSLQPEDTRNAYVALRNALKERFKPTAQEILDTWGFIYMMRQGPTQSFKDFANQVQRKAKTIAMPDDEVVGICINGARPSLKAHLAMAKPESMDELLKLPVVVTEIHDEPQFSIAMLKDINTKVDYLASVHNVQQQPTKSVTFREPTRRRSTSRSPARPSHQEYYSGHQDNGPSQYRRQDNNYYGPPPTSYRGPPPHGPPRSYRGPPPQGQYGPPRFATSRDTRPRTPHNWTPRTWTSPQNCGRCFTQCRGGQQCPAYRRQCFRCGGMGHFKSACRSRDQYQFNGQ